MGIGVALAGVATSVERLSARTDDLARAVSLSTVRPRPVPLDASAIADANGNALLVFDACPTARSWHLMRLTVGGVTWATAAAGAALTFVTSAQPTSPEAPVPLVSVVAEAATMPSVSYYGEKGHQVPLAPRERLVILITGGTSGQEYVARAQIDDFPQDLTYP